jgi:hypothetical protein
MRVAILTVSDGCARGERQDESGVRIEAWCTSKGFEIAAREVVPDETAAIVPLRWRRERALLRFAAVRCRSRRLERSPTASQIVISRGRPGGEGRPCRAPCLR